jgi:hypothetical protein
MAAIEFLLAYNQGQNEDGDQERQELLRHCTFSLFKLCSTDSGVSGITDVSPRLFLEDAGMRSGVSWRK